jgi:hypothetical protein
MEPGRFVFEATWPFEPTRPPESSDARDPRDARVARDARMSVDGRAKPAAPVRRTSTLLCAATVPTVVNARQYRYLLLPLQNRILSTAPSREAMIDDLVRGESCSSALANLLRGEINPQQYNTSAELKSVVWQTAMREPALPRFAGAETYRTFRIPSWPALGTQHQDRVHMRLAALYSRSACTISHGCEVVGVSHQHVAAFLSACVATGVRVTCLDRGTAETVWPRQPLVSGLQLQRLRRHLHGSAALDALDTLETLHA